MKSYRRPYCIKKKKSIFRNRFFWFFLFSLVIIGVISYSIFFLSYFQIKKIDVSGNEKISTEEIKNIIVEQINQKIFFFNSKSIFFVNLKKTEGKILEKFPLILEVKVKRNFPDVLTVKIKERILVGTFCQEADCYYIDELGIIFEKININQKIQPIIKSEVFKHNLVLGNPVFEKKYFKEILNINNALTENTKLDITEFIVSGDGEKLKVKISENWKIFFDIEENISNQIYNLNLILKEKISLEERKNLEYINLMFGNRVYYKFKNN